MSTGHYVGPVILASDAEAARKYRVIEIYKNEVYKDIDLHTHKHVEGSGSEDLRARNAVSSDSTEDVDSAVIARYVEFRDAILRSHIRFALADKTREYAADPLTLDKNKYRYELIVPDDFNDNTMRPLAEFIHRFLVFGALYDWYAQFGDQRQAAICKGQMDGLEETIKSALRGGSIQKRPMQPFGPAYKFK